MTNVTGTFEASDLFTDTVETPIAFFNDDIDEVEQFFIVKLELVSAINPDRVNVQPSIAQCRITDDDGKLLFCIDLIFITSLHLPIFE